MNFSCASGNRLARSIPKRRAAGMLVGMLAIVLAAADARKADEKVAAPPPAYLVSVPLPLDGDGDVQLMASVDKLLESLPDGEQRAVMIFAFRAAEGKSTGTTRFERALALARYLAGEQFSRVRTVAFLPKSVQGHAVLPVLACEEIIMAPDAELGAAGRNESSIDDTVRGAYRGIAERRRTIPVPIVMGMLDAALTVTEVQLVGGGVRYVLPDELEALRADAKVWKEKTVIPADEYGIFTGRQLRLRFGFVSHLASDRKQLAEALQLSPGSVIDVAEGPGTWKAIRVQLHGRVTSRSVNEAILAIQRGVSKRRANLVFLEIDSPGGAVEPAVRLINVLADLDPQKVRTVAYVSTQALSVSGLIALVCDETYASEEARLGGPGDAYLNARELDDLRQCIDEVARTKGRDWSLLMAMADPKLAVVQYRRQGTGETRYFCDAELEERADADQWKKVRPLKLEDGISGNEARQLRLVRATLATPEAVFARFHIDQPIDVAKRNSVVSSLEQLAMEPWFARTLLFIAFFALITEASAPGLGAAGFVSGLCFLLFFWSQFLSGTAGWLELLLFGGGLVCIALEIFVIPGFGIFGVGGGIMVLGSIVLASQTFIIPRNSYQLDQLPSSLFSMIAASGGVLAALWILRKVLPEAPLFRRMMVTPPDAEELEETEKLVDWNYLEGKRGVTTTQLTPSGKARFGDEIVDVISDGELVARGTPVRVEQVRGNHVLVEPLDES